MKSKMPQLLAVTLALFGEALAAPAPMLSEGDIAFVGFNAQGVDNIAIVNLVSLPAHTILRFCDSEWNGTGFGVDEGDFTWDSGDEELPAGTVVNFDGLDGTLVVNHGSITIANNGGFSTSGEAMFVFEGSAERTPSAMLAAIATSSTALFSATGDYSNLGLHADSTALVFSGAMIGLYTGELTKSTKEEMLLSIMNPNNWITQSTANAYDDGIHPDLPLTAGPQPTEPSVSFASKFSVTQDTTDSISVIIKLSAANTIKTLVDIQWVDLESASASHFTFADTTLELATGVLSDTLMIPVTVNLNETSDVYFALKIASASSATLGSVVQHVAYIRKSARTAPVATDSLGVQWLSNYQVDADGSAEIVAYHAGNKRLFVLNSTGIKVEVVDFSNPLSMSTIKTVDMSAHGLGATSVAVWGNYVAATVDAGPEANGKLVLMDTAGTVMSVVTVGNLPDMVTFTPDGKKVLTANEGQPLSDYSVDAEGSISVVDISNGISNITDANVTTIGFGDWNAKKDSLVNLGMRVFGPNATLAQDVEPEYITITKDSKKAWVSLQENNAVAELDLENLTILKIMPLGFKDHSLVGNEMDASDKTGAVLLANWPVHGMYLPDGMANYEVGGSHYILTANEGDVREYDGLVEETVVGDAGYILDPTVFPNAAYLKKEETLGRLAVTKTCGDTDKDGDFDKICSFGSRSFSIWNATTGELVFDSQSDFERITSLDATYGAIFNAGNDNVKFKNRSDNKGPEPEGIALGTIRERTYAFIALERVGGLMVYDVTNPLEPQFTSYTNHRSLTDGSVGDLGPEGIVYISAEESPIDTALVVMANEVSATVSVYKLNDVHTGNSTAIRTQKNRSMTYQIQDGVVYFSAPVQYTIYNFLGKKIQEGSDAAWIDSNQLPQGLYFLRTSQGLSITLQK